MNDEYKKTEKSDIPLSLTGPYYYVTIALNI